MSFSRCPLGGLAGHEWLSAGPLAATCSPEPAPAPMRCESPTSAARAWRTMNTSPSSSTRWWSRFHELQELCVKLNRFPSRRDFRSYSSPHESLEAWIWRQRRAHLTDAQTEALASLPGFDWAPRETRWDQMLAQYKDFVALHGTTPRFRSPTREERALADWFARQWRLMRSGNLTHRRVMELRAIAQTPLTDTHEQ
jgi:hypothetical protein